MQDNATDEEIISRHNQGDAEAFKFIVEKYTTPLYNFTARLTNKNNADDIVQEIFIKIWKKIQTYNPNKASFKTWLFTIARNTIIDYSRKKQEIVFSDIGTEEDKISKIYEDIPDENLLPDEVLQKISDKETLNKVLAKIKTIYREVLILHYQEEMTFEEIGKTLKRPTNTIKSQHRRALIELRELLQ